MTYDVYRYIFIGALVLSLLCLAIAILLFFVLRIPKVVGDLTGYSAKKAIEKLRTQSAEDDKNGNKSDSSKRNRETLTDKITPSGHLIKNSAASIDGGGMETTKISTDRLENEALQSYETSLLDNGGSAETTILDSFDNSETTVLTQNNEVFTIEREILFIHSNEIIS